MVGDNAIEASQPEFSEDWTNWVHLCAEMDPILQNLSGFGQVHPWIHQEQVGQEHTQTVWWAFITIPLALSTK